MKIWTYANGDELYIGFSFVGFLCGLIICAFALISSSYIKKSNHDIDYKQGYTDGYQARIDLERSW